MMAARAKNPLFLAAAATSGGLTIGRLVLLSCPDGEQFSEGVILVADEIAAEHVLAMEQDTVCGFVTAKGGITGQTLIMAGNMGLPALVGLGDQLTLLEHGEVVILDGVKGGLWLYPSPEQLRQAESDIAVLQAQKEQDEIYSYLPAETLDGFSVEVLANLELVESASLALARGAQGVGLFRSESYYALCDKAPNEEMFTALYEHLLITFAPLPVTVRTLDFGSDSGLRGGRLTIQGQLRCKSQLRALLRAAPSGFLRLVFPMLSTPMEIRQMRDMVAALQQELADQSIPHADKIDMGVMIEVPAAAALIGELAAEVDFLTIGTNDLIQFICGAERDSPQLAHLYDPLNPLVLDMIAQVIEVGHDHGLKVGVCGEMASDLRYLPLLLGLGVDNLSLSPAIIPRLKKMVRASLYTDMVALTKAVRQSAGSERAVLLQGYLRQHHADEFTA